MFGKNIKSILGKIKDDSYAEIKINHVNEVLFNKLIFSFYEQLGSEPEYSKYSLNKFSDPANVNPKNKNKLIEKISPNLTTWYREITLDKTEIKDYGLKVSLKYRMNALKLPIYEKFLETRKIIEEKSFCFNGGYRLSLYTISKHGGKTTKKSIKLIFGSDFDTEKLDIVFNDIYLRYNNDSFELYTFDEKKFVLKSLQDISGKHNLIDIQNSDLVNGVIVNDDFLYRIALKTDGEKIYLVINKLGIWLCNPPYCQFLKRVNTEMTLIVEGEIIDNDFHVVDCLDINGSLIDHVHSERINFFTNDKLADLEKIVSGLGLNIRMKTFVAIKTIKNTDGIHDYFSVMNNMLNLYNENNATNDGLVFIPDTIYGDLTPHLKWKPRNKYTVDLRVIHGESGFITLYAYNHPNMDISKSRIDMDVVPGAKDLNLNKRIYNGSVVEFLIIGDELKPYRLRLTKTQPNSLKLAWKIINENKHNTLITPEKIFGENLFYVRQYHNRIKRKLYEDNPGEVLLDIGSGYGGDIGKQKGHYKKVFSLEPDEENREELFDRLDKIRGSSSTKYYVLPLKGEDDEIVYKAVSFLNNGKQVDVISLMLSMSFFWESKEKVKGLINTIKRCLKPGGKIIFLTIDGMRIESHFRPPLSNVNQESNTISGKGFLLSYIKDNNDDKYVEVRIDKSIVGSFGEFETDIPQKEWLVNVSKFIDELSDDYETHTADKEKLMTPAEETWTKLYTYGTLKYTKTTKLPQSKLNLLPIHNFDETVTLFDVKMIKLSNSQTILDSYFSSISNLEGIKGERISKLKTSNIKLDDYSLIVKNFKKGMVFNFVTKDGIIPFYQTDVPFSEDDHVDIYFVKDGIAVEDLGT